ncbi:MAG: inositol monophosphatase [bacterium]
MYREVIAKIVELGNTLPAICGSVMDVGQNKQWLTEKEVEIEEALVNLIKTFHGEHFFYAEESHREFVERESIWIIDSISNTTNFIHGMPHYSIVLSHLLKGEVNFAVVYDPSNKELFTAEKGKGSFLNNKKMRVSSRKEDIFCMVGPYFTPPRIYREKALAVINKLSDAGITVRIVGSLALHYSYVACGRADAAVSFNEDTFPEFAGKLLVEEAGGKFTDFDGGVLNNETVGVIATNGLVHEQIKNIVKSVV